MDWLLGFAFFGAAWAGGFVADAVRDRLLASHPDSDLKRRIRDIIFVLWFAACFLAAGFFLSRAYPCGAGCST